MQYVIDDKYVEFRKALAEGKIVEIAIDYNDENGYIWKNIEDEEFHHFNVDEIRIKPEEPKFKVGDWVRIKTGTFEYDGTARISKGVKQLSKSDMWLFSENHYKCNPDNYIEHWQPKPEEWCWFWNDSDDMPILAKLISIDSVFERPLEYKVKTPSCISETTYNYMSNMSFKKCEPYIGELPTNLKGLK